MLNALWAGMIIVGVIWAAIHGNMEAVTGGVLESAKEAVNLAITMLGVMSFWCGILKIGENAGLIQLLTKKMKPVIRFLFPQMPQNHPAEQHISTNMIANLLGLGWAATPAGLRAMKELIQLEKERGNKKWTDGASDEMCTFLVINISSLQLIPINMIAYRSQYGSTDPTAIVGPVIAATAVSTMAAGETLDSKCTPVSSTTSLPPASSTIASCASTCFSTAL